MIQAFGLTSDSRKDLPPAVDDVSFEAHAGRVTVLLGAAGAGKTTALRLMLELQHGRGITYFKGRPLHRIPHPAREVGVLLGDVPGHPSRSVRGHLRMLCAAAGLPVRRADEVLEVVGLVSLREERLGTLSRGVDRRLGLACALLSDPHTLVLDEPADGLSARESRWLHGVLRAHATQGGTVLFTTSDPKEAARTADRVVTIERGRVVADQESADFARNRLRPRVAVRSPQAARLAALLSKEARTGRRSVEVVREEGNRLSVYGSTCADVGEVAFRHGILVHQLADEVGDMGPGAGGAEPAAVTTATAAEPVPVPASVLAAVSATARAADETDMRKQDAGQPETFESTEISGLTGTSEPAEAPELTDTPATTAAVHPGDDPARAEPQRLSDRASSETAAASVSTPAPKTPSATSTSSAPKTPPATRTSSAPKAPFTEKPPSTAAASEEAHAEAAPHASIPTPRPAETVALDPSSPLPPPISVRPGRSPLRPLRYELRRAAGIGTGFVTAAAVLVVSALTALVMGRIGHTPQPRLLAAWPQQLPLPPAALGAGLLGALSFGDEFRHPALAADRGTVPRRLGLLTAKLLVSAATALTLAFLTVGCDAEVLYVVYGRELTQVPGDWISLGASWAGLVVGCGWAGVLAAGLFRSATAGLAAVVAVPVVVAPLVQAAMGGEAWDPTGLPARLRRSFLLQWPFGGDGLLVAAARVISQPLGAAMVLMVSALSCAYLVTTLRSRVK
ncbi:ABC transporter ATP-binding protein [Streptomyces naganishii]|uniref:ABC transporter ATP-binding protein n=1 Tax=Streptomyces naganishii TaxID=285447 RepID=UPI00167CDA53|nr:ABC transporter ATP-binding protein [Streptomyces naganishii]